MLREHLAAAVTLNAVANNIARALGPTVGGIVIALAGASAAFYLNAVATLTLVGALLWWRREIPVDDLPRERIGSHRFGPELAVTFCPESVVRRMIARGSEMDMPLAG